ncbi:SDR family NAD(P)-dependent oxidoreductase [Modestobacter versicolor]|uniref:SDR family NAD(P)-dependent oxidoreductase n=1 Tax=Modestobacter versicolor TaxID=429133 RepID=UPI0034DED4EE
MSGQQTVVVTGAASGMGRAVVDRLLAAGDRVVGLDRDADVLADLDSALGRSFVPLAVDVADRDAVTGGLDAVLSGATVRAVVNAAGIYPPTTLADVTRELHDRVFGVNVLGTLLVTAAVVPHLQAAGGGAVVNFASVDAFAVSPGQLLYSASKAAVLALTRSLAVELAPDRIVVNAVAPGWVDTPGNAATGRMAEAAAGIPLGRVAQPDEVALWVQRLTEPGYVTGETVVIAGGSAMR